MITFKDFFSFKNNRFFWLNLIAILLLSRTGVKVLKDYEAQVKAGGPLTFDPEALGIRNTDCWKR